MGGVEMSVIDMTTTLALIALFIVRLGVPILLVWVLTTALKRALPAQTPV
jgi:hypothetical protein